MQKVKVLYIISFIDKALIYEWQSIRLMDSPEVDVKFVLMNPEPLSLSKYLREQNIPYIDIKYRGSKDLWRVIPQLYKIIRNEKPDVVNTNLIDASFAGQIAAYFARTPYRIHSRHYSDLHHRYHRHALMYDKIMNRISSRIVVATNMVKGILTEKEGVAKDKISVVPYGFDLKAFTDVDQERIENLRKKYIPEGKGPVIGVISRFTHWKGIHYIIPAYRKILTEFPNAYILLANANGDYKTELMAMLNDLPEGSWGTISYEKDSPALYKLFDIFIHVPIDYDVEAYGQIYVETLAAKIPAIFTLSGIAHDFAENEDNCLIVPYKDEEAIAKAAIKLLNDESLREKISANGLKLALERFDIQRMVDDMIKIFKEKP